MSDPEGAGGGSDAPDLHALADVVRYRGSGEHKRHPNPLCPPSLRSDKSDCDQVDSTVSQDPARLDRWLREAFRRGQVDRVREGRFPRKAWGWVRLAGGARALFEARLANRSAGEYKGYFVTLDDFVGKRAWVLPHLAEGGDWWSLIP